MATETVVEERWECQIPGRVWVRVRDYDGRPRDVSVRGIGSILRLNRDDRIRAQEAIPQATSDPFRNGMMLRLDADQQDDTDTASSDALSRTQLKDTFELELDDFREYVGTLGEVNVRRLKQMTSEVDASVNKTKFIDELIAERYSIGKDTPTYREMQSGPMTPS